MAPFIFDSYEHRMCDLLQARPATLEEQYRGIDFWIGGVSVSVKNQKAASRTGNYAFELVLTALDGRTRMGAFRKDESQVTLMTAGDDWHHFFLTDELKKYANEEKGRYVSCNEETKAENIRQGRTYIDAVNVLFPVKDINALSFLSFEGYAFDLLVDLFTEIIEREANGCDTLGDIGRANSDAVCNSY